MYVHRLAMPLYTPKPNGDFRQSTDENTIFTVLSSQRRRQLLRLLHQRGGQQELADLAAHVAAAEVGTSVDELSPSERKRVYISCYQTHLPQLVEAGLIEYDAGTGTIRNTDNFSDVGPYLGWESDTQWPHRYHLGLALVSFAFYVGVLLEVPLLGMLSLTVAGLVVVVSFIGLTVGLLFLEWRA